MIESQQSAVGNRYAVCVTRQILKDMRLRYQTLVRGARPHAIFDNANPLCIGPSRRLSREPPGAQQQVLACSPWIDTQRIAYRKAACRIHRHAEVYILGQFLAGGSAYGVIYLGGRETRKTQNCKGESHCVCATTACTAFATGVY